MPTPKQTSNTTPVITQNDEEAASTIDNKPRPYTNNIQTNLLQFRAPAAITHDVVYAFLGAAMLDDSTHFVPNSMMPTW